MGWACVCVKNRGVCVFVSELVFERRGKRERVCVCVREREREREMWNIMEVMVITSVSKDS